jgi:hypothetical protein
MLDRLLPLFVGLILIFGGIYTFFFRTFDSWKYDLVDMGPFHPAIGVIFVMIGLFLSYTTVRNMIKRK